MSLFPLFYRRLPAQMQTPPEFTITLQYSLFRPQNQGLQPITIVQNELNFLNTHAL